ncbi:transmembrane glycosyltransferase [Sphingobacterium sp. KB22]|uniref:Transmembrane glycosyltransferase n=1 Tax=Sphingobacterium hungaricum TaxID=2082723 RepID=A0A928YQA5_9SPHI|nr:transmembrane glycosyltransferase [Sphingobacterium hungaricum]
MQLYYIFFVYGKLAFFKVVSNTQESLQMPISIIISAHNEQKNLKAFLPSILNQNYPEFELIVVNDCSDDDTKWILQDFCREYSFMRVIEIKEHIQLKHTKKFALTMGIKGAKYEHLVFTDADCEPASPNWLSEMAGCFSEGKEIILGYSPYFKQSGFLNKLIRFETSHTAMSYLSYALKKDAYMGVGRNLAYTKSLFFKGKGFNAHMHIKSGDDDLFVNHNATKENVAISIYPDAHVYSLPKESWKGYNKQKGRHSTASVLYKGKHKRMLGTQLVTALLFYVVLIACIAVFPSLWYIPVGMYVLRLISQFIIFSSIYKKLQVADLLWWLPILDIYYYFYICLNGLFNRKKKQVSWK